MKEIRCTYCNKPTKDPTREHIIPKSIGGNISPENPFVINTVCSGCNNTCGLYVDLEFSRNWFVDSSKFELVSKYLNLKKSPILPLRYLGEIEEYKWEDRICSLWMTVKGEMVYHFHKPYPKIKDLSPIIGIHSSQRKEVDAGFVFIMLRVTNIEWQKTILNSFVSHFKKSTKYLANGNMPRGGAFSEIPKELFKLRDLLLEKRNMEHNIQCVTGIFSGERFLAKLALGFAQLFLEEDFFNTEEAKSLRKCLWTSDHTIRKDIKLYGRNFFKPETGYVESMFKWEYGHFISILKVEEKIVLYVNFYANNPASIVICSNSDLLKEKLDTGIVYLVAPGFQKYIKLFYHDYLAHTISSPELKNEELSKLENHIITNMYKPKEDAL